MVAEDASVRVHVSTERCGDDECDCVNQYERVAFYESGLLERYVTMGTSCECVDSRITDFVWSRSDVGWTMTITEREHPFCGEWERSPEEFDTDRMAYDDGELPDPQDEPTTCAFEVDEAGASAMLSCDRGVHTARRVHR